MRPSVPAAGPWMRCCGPWPGAACATRADRARRAGRRQLGKIYDALVAEMPSLHNAETTPCGGGVFSVVPTGTLVIGSTSNLGAYGVCAALAIVKQDLTLCHTFEDEVALHYVGVGLGMSDGGSGAIVAGCDGIPARTNASIVEVMRTIVELELAKPRERNF